MNRTKRRTKGNPADLRVRNILFTDTAGKLPQMVDGDENPVILRVTLPCKVDVPLGLSVRYPDYNFDGAAFVTLYGGAREFKKEGVR